MPHISTHPPFLNVRGRVQIDPGLLTTPPNLEVFTQGVSGTLAKIDFNFAATLTGALVGKNIDLTTNVTPGAQAVTGLLVKIPATTRANTALEGAIVVDS